jgi:hypothetical protein
VQQRGIKVADRAVASFQVLTGDWRLHENNAGRLRRRIFK